MQFQAYSWDKAQKTLQNKRNLTVEEENIWN